MCSATHKRGHGRRHTSAAEWRQFYLLTWLICLVLQVVCRLQDERMLGRFSPGLFEAVEPQARRGAGTAAANTECCPAHVELNAVTPYFHQCLRNG